MKAIKANRYIYDKITTTDTGPADKNKVLLCCLERIWEKRLNNTETTWILGYIYPLLLFLGMERYCMSLKTHYFILIWWLIASTWFLFTNLTISICSFDNHQWFEMATNNCCKTKEFVENNDRQESVSELKKKFWNGRFEKRRVIPRPTERRIT